MHNAPSSPLPATAPAAGQNADALFAAIVNRRSMGLSRIKPDPVDRRLIERMLELDKVKDIRQLRPLLQRG